MRRPDSPPPGGAPTGRAAGPFPSRAGPGPWATFVHAWNGLLHTLLHQPNMRVHVVSGILVGLVGCGMPLGLAEKVTLIFCVLLVFFAEILNSALEHLVDLAVQQFDEKARLTKDAAAAGVLVLSMGTVVIFAALLVHNWDAIAGRGAEIRVQILLGLPMAGSAALLMWPWGRPRWVDGLLFAGGTLLMLTLAVRSYSAVFSALTYSLLVLAFAAALERRRTRRG